MSAQRNTPERGEVWFVDLDPTRGHEPGGERPALILSANEFNRGPAELFIILPITSKDKNIYTHVSVLPPEGGLNKISFIKCEDIRSISEERLIRRLGQVSSETLQAAEKTVKLLLQL